MKTILIFFPVLFSALFVVSTQMRDISYEPTTETDAPAQSGSVAPLVVRDAPEADMSGAVAAVRPPEPEPENLPASKLLDVPFASQAPYEDWHLPYKEACEETSIIMVQYYLQ